MIDLEEFLARSGIELRSLEQWIDRDWLIAERRSATILLTEVDAARARLIHDLKGDLGVNDEGIEIVLHLVDQLHGLRQALEQIRGEAQATRRRDIRRARQRQPVKLVPARRKP